MLRRFLLISTLVLLLAGNAVAGFSSSSYDTSGSVVAAVEIENKGIYNLITSIQFIRKPQDKKVFGSDEYINMISQLMVEAQGVMLQKILEAKPMKVNELATLKMAIESEIKSLIEITKKKHGISSETEVIYSINSFYLLEPKNN